MASPRGRWPRVAVVGAGAVGGYFGGLMAKAGAPVVMIGRQAFVEAVNRDGLFLDTLHFKQRIRVEASTDLTAVRGADLVLFCVKTTDNASTARALAALLSPDATVVTLQNGVDNVEQIRAAAGIDALPAVVYVAASVPAPGHVKHVGRGDLVLGPECDRVKQIAETFTHANIPCRISDNIEGELWNKLICNCALNAISALARVKYGQIAENGDGQKLVAAIVDEAMAVARAAGIVLVGREERDAQIAASMDIATGSAQAFSSTAQDINRGKRTEIDSLNGYIARRGTEHGVPTPVNHALYTLVKMLEG
jgi:2-dehydropantoate 2-reductase